MANIITWYCELLIYRSYGVGKASIAPGGASQRGIRFSLGESDSAREEI